jgi:protein gp37
MAKRLKGRSGYPADEPFRVTLHEDKLDVPLRWRKPRRIFVVSMGDLFHEDVPRRWQVLVWRRMISCPQHTFMVLTKRPERMREFVRDSLLFPVFPNRPLPNVWLGVTAENQAMAEERVPVLLSIPAAVRFVSCEPCLGPVKLDNPSAPLLRGLQWVIAGGESGPKRRPSDPEWFRSLRDQCAAAGVPFFLKQMEVDGRVVKMPELDGVVHDARPGTENPSTVLRTGAER